MKWDIIVPVKQVNGHQMWRVEADSKAQAIEKFRTDDDCEFLDDELEVVDLDLEHMEVSEAEDEL
jgi:hypothetical protein